MKKYNKHLIIVGTGRSGTSWLSEIIATKPRYRMLFEPGHEKRTPNGILICDKLIRNKQEAGEEVIAYLKRVFANKVDCDWIAQISDRRFKRHLWPIIPKKFIIKFVRCNLSAKFINEHFGIPLVHIIRHPYSVIYSQQRVNFPWLYDMTHFAKQENLIALVKEISGIDLRHIDKYSSTELLALRWAIENCIPLEIIGGYDSNALVVKHEEISNDINMFFNLCNKFNIKPRMDIEKVYKKPSSKTHLKSYISLGNKGPSQLSLSEKKKVKQILQLFNSKLYEL